MTSAWRSLRLSRIRGALALLFAITFLAAASMSLGAGLLARARSDAREVPAVAEYYVVARSSEASDMRSGLEARQSVRVVSERRAGELLAAGGREFGPEHLTVFEVERPTHAPGRFQVDGAVDVIDVNAEARTMFTWERVVRGGVVGGVLLVLGCLVFVWAVIGCVETAGRACQDAIGVRVLLGAEADHVWRVLGLVVGSVALAGGFSSFAFLTFAMRTEMGAGSFPLLWALGGVAALLFGTVALSLGAARRAVARAARATVLASLIAAFAWGSASAARAEPSETPNGPIRNADVLRALSRDIAVCRRAVHVARKGMAATEHQAVLAAAARDEARLRIAVAKRVESLAALRREEKRCEALVVERVRLREVLRSVRLFGPPITPRRPPVAGAVAVRWGEAGRRPGTHAYRNGIAMRTRGGESVRATATGRVAYAGELPGSGAVVVIDHGRRTYSVYARIENGVVSVGQEVEAGETVARARQGLLYFSIRHRGRAVDPLAWLANAPPV